MKDIQENKKTSSARTEYFNFINKDLQNLKLAKEEEEKIQKAQELTFG